MGRDDSAAVVREAAAAAGTPPDVTDRVIDRLRPSVRLEHWDGEPPPVPPGHDVQQTVDLQLPTGKIRIDQIAGGWGMIDMTLPPGRHAVRITGWGRDSARSSVKELWSTRDPTGSRSPMPGSGGCHRRGRSGSPSMTRALWFSFRPRYLFDRPQPGTPRSPGLV